MSTKFLRSFDRKSKLLLAVLVAVFLCAAALWLAGATPDEANLSPPRMLGG